MRITIALVFIKECRRCRFDFEPRRVLIQLSLQLTLVGHDAIANTLG
jgi:hypothetical protein